MSTDSVELLEIVLDAIEKFTYQSLTPLRGEIEWNLREKNNLLANQRIEFSKVDNLAETIVSYLKAKDKPILLKALKRKFGVNHESLKTLEQRGLIVEGKDQYKEPTFEIKRQ
jgi:hypothetical protein